VLASFYRLTVFGKNQKANLSIAERNALAALVKLLIQAAGLNAYSPPVEH